MYEWKQKGEGTVVTVLVTVGLGKKPKQKSGWTRTRVFLSPPIVSTRRGKSITAPIQRPKRGRAVLLQRGHHLVSGVLERLCVIRAVPADEDLVKTRQRAIAEVKSFCQRLVSPPGFTYTNRSCQSLHTWPYFPAPEPCPHQWKRTVARREADAAPEPVAALTIAPLQSKASANRTLPTVTEPRSSDEQTCQRQHQLTRVTVPTVRPPLWEVSVAKKTTQDRTLRSANALDEYVASHPQLHKLPRPVISRCPARRAPKPKAEPRSPRNSRSSPSRRPSARREAELRRERRRRF
uniref:Uncharacterized protein n=1 Tax=Trichogramma kaykai TaxID=54128 RepID=A0ABD2WH83_9HYME